MKKFYVLIFAAFSYTLAFAQDPVSGCNDPAGGIQLIFDDATGCTPGALAGMTEVGFHSGMNGFMNVIDWNASGAVTGANDGNDDFIIYIADVAAYYATLKANQGAVSEDQAELAKEGEKIYKGGVAKGNIPSCMGCHGPTGQGIPNHFPHIAGQHAQYLETQLLAFKKGERKGYNQIMSTLSFNLSEQQIKALAVYMSGLN